MTTAVVVAWPEPIEPGSTMTASVFREFGPPDVLHLAEVAAPRPGPDEVVVQVAAVAAGRYLDLAARAGTHPYPGYRSPHILGAEHAGLVAAVGSGVTDWTVGERVAVFPAVSCGACGHCRGGDDEMCAGLELLGMHRPGAYAAYVAVPARNLRRVPESVDPEQATALALGGAVVLNQLGRARFRSGQWVLVQGASGALGSMTVALVRHLGGHPVALSRDADKRARLVELGAEHVMDPAEHDLAGNIAEVTGGRGVDIVVDNLGDSALWEISMAALATGGHLVTSGAFLGRSVPVDPSMLYLRSQHILGVRSGNHATASAIWQEVERGFRPVLGTTFGLADAAAAHRFLETDQHVGRVTLIVPQAN